MTPAEITAKVAEARGLAEKATPGPWTNEPGTFWIANVGNNADDPGVWSKAIPADGTPYPFADKKDDAAFIAAARTLVPDLCAIIENLVGEPELLQAGFRREKDLQALIEQQAARIAELEAPPKDGEVAESINWLHGEGQAYTRLGWTTPGQQFLKAAALLTRVDADRLQGQVKAWVKECADAKSHLIRVLPLAKNDASMMEAMSRHQPVPGTETAEFGAKVDDDLLAVNAAYSFVGLEPPFATRGAKP